MLFSRYVEDILAMIYMQQHHYKPGLSHIQSNEILKNSVNLWDLCIKVF